MHKMMVKYAGKQLSTATKALIMVHGRGGSAEDILSLTSHLDVHEYALIAPQADGNTWYPFSFLVPPSQNEPSLSSSLAVLKQILDDVSNNISTMNIYFLGFS